MDRDSIVQVLENYDFTISYEQLSLQKEPSS